MYCGTQVTELGGNNVCTIASSPFAIVDSTTPLNCPVVLEGNSLSTSANSNSYFTTTNSLCADFTKGCYELSNGSIKNL